jgi:hypothetical protein
MDDLLLSHFFISGKDLVLEKLLFLLLLCRVSSKILPFFLPFRGHRTFLTHFTKQGAVLYQGVSHARLLPVRSSKMLPMAPGERKWKVFSRNSLSQHWKLRGNNFSK